ncbi:hypothetical protein B0H14DRAFT_2594226 [Mycena olivaceomarginata]|nr:hypothetical protein B0H14DRAFT_2594226 [Mycena olivaceomarginata]
MPAKKNKNKEHPATSSPNQVLSAKEQHAEAQANRRAYIKSSEELSRHAETRWGIDKEYCEVKRMRTYTARHGLAAPTNCYIPARKLGQAVAFLQLVPNGQMLENEKNSLPPSSSRFRMACVLKFFQGTKFNSVEDQDSSSQKSWYLVWDVGLFTSRTEAKAYLDNPSSQALTQHLQRSDTLEKALPYPPPPNLIYGHTIKEESPLPLIKLELSRHQPSRSSSRVVRAMPTPNSNSPNASPVSGVSTQSSQPANVSVEGKQKALEGLSALRSKSSKAATPVKSKQKSSRDDDKEVDKPPRKRQKKSEEGSANGSTVTRLGRTTGMC